MTPPNHLAKAIYKRMYRFILNCLASHESMTSTLIRGKSANQNDGTYIELSFHHAESGCFNYRTPNPHMLASHKGSFSNFATQRLCFHITANSRPLSPRSHLGMGMVTGQSATFVFTGCWESKSAYPGRRVQRFYILQNFGPRIRKSKSQRNSRVKNCYSINQNPQESQIQNFGS